MNATVLNILDESKKSKLSHRNNAAKLKKLAATESITECLLRDGVDRVLLCVKSDSEVERVSTFICNYFVSSGSEQIFSEGLAHLLQRSQAADKNVRSRACKMIGEWLASANELTNLSDDSIDTIILTILPRLRDKIVAVRSCGIQALKTLQNPENSESDEIMTEFLRLIKSDPSKEVRVSALEAIILTPHNLQFVADRVCDIDPSVRIAALSRLSNSVKHLPARTRALVMQHSLVDRDPAVNKAARVLLFKWLQSVDGSAPRLLRLIGLDEHFAIAEQVGNVLVQEILSNSDQTVGSQRNQLYESRIDWGAMKGFSVHTSSELLWAKVRCQYAAQRMSPSHRTELVDAIMPDLIQIGDLIRTEGILKWRQGQFSTYDALCVRLLFGLVASIEYADAVGSTTMSAVCEEVLRDIDFPSSVVDDVLSAWITVHSLTGMSCETKMQALICLGEEVRTTTVANDNEHTPEERKFMMIHRSLLIITWTLQQNIGAVRQTFSADFCQVIQNLVPVLLESVQLPVAELRSLSIRALGMLGLVSKEIFSSQVEHILFQAAATSIEDESIRCSALSSLVDAVVVGHCKDTTTLTGLLNRTMIGSCDILKEAAIMSIVKLLYSDTIKDSDLLCHVLTPFLLPETVPVVSPSTSSSLRRASQSTIDDSNDESSCKDDSLPQVLSVFFSTYFELNKERIALLLPALPNLLASTVRFVRDSVCVSSSLSRVLLHCQQWVEAIGEQSMMKEFHAVVAASMCLEMLKLGRSKADQIVLKECLKAFDLPGLGNVSDGWADSEACETISSVCASVIREQGGLKKMEKTTQVTIREITEACSRDRTTRKPQLQRFVDLAPGLRNLLAVVDDANDDDALTNDAAETIDESDAQSQADTDSDDTSSDFE